MLRFWNANFSFTTGPLWSGRTEGTGPLTICWQIKKLSVYIKNFFHAD